VDGSLEIERGIQRGKSRNSWTPAEAWIFA
jgi:hypothetical protein